MIASWELFAFGSLVVFGAFFVRSLTGFGSALISIPLLALVFDLPLVVPLEAVLELAVTLLLFAQIYRAVDWPTLLPMMVGVTVGALAGVYLLTNVSSALLKQVLGVLILGYALYLWLRHEQMAQQRQHRPVWALAAGGIGGIIGGTVGTSGPPYVMYLAYRLHDKGVLRATLTALFGFDGLWRIGVFAYHGLLTPATLWSALWLLPALTAGAILGHYAHLNVSQQRFTQVMALILGVAGVLLLL
ncbi:MAG: sulfite exporter TauE/SafE family protein [Caldilineaceae bacterium]